jgi:HlyD family secretion protein
MKWRSKKVLFGGLLVVVLIVIAAVSLSSSDNGGTQVQADLAFLDEIAEVVTASGRVEPQTKVDITSEVSAQIIEIYVHDGDRVERGDPLLLLDTVQLNSDVSQARYSLLELSARAAAAQSTYRRDELEYERQSRLYEQQLTSETAYTNAQFTLETSKANYEAMRAQVNTSRARLEKAEDNLRKTGIVAPMAGVVTFLGAEVGEIAQAQTAFTQGKTLMTIADLSVFEVEVDVDETEVAKVRPDQPAEIRVDAFADSVFAGTVVEIGNSALVVGQGTENYTTSFRVKVRFAQTEAAIRPGMSATVDITTAREPEALLIPYAAVVTREFDPDADSVERRSPTDTGGLHAAEPDHPDTVAAAPDTVTLDEGEASGPKKKKEKTRRTGVFLCKDGKAHFVEVSTGIADERNIVALTGLAPGDTVISGSFQTLRKLEEGDDVAIEERSLKKMRGEDS